MKANNYYIFSETKTNRLGKNLKIIKISTVQLTDSLRSRLSYLKLPKSDKLFIYEIEVENDEISPNFENDIYYDDSSIAIHKLLCDKDAFYGSSSRRINRILGSIIEYRDDDNNISIKGDGGWKSLKDLFDILRSSNVKYLVLRKFETLPMSFLEGDHDIDILCESINEIVLTTGATKRNEGISAFCLYISGIKTDFDIRYIGDNYLDSQWARNALNNRKCNNGVFIMDDENQLFTIIYHCLTQKNNISDYYSDKIATISMRLFGNKLPNADTELCLYLARYMTSNAYGYIKPKDISVIQNKNNIQIIKKEMKKLCLSPNSHALKNRLLTKVRRLFPRNQR